MLKYQIALVSVFWSQDDIDTRFFDSVETQNTYFDQLTNGKFSPLVNFNMGNNIETSVIYKDTTTRPVQELVGCNYAVIKTFNDEGVVIDRRYFFAYPSQDSGRQLRVTLSLDDIQTNYFKYKNTIQPCVINRACLNRWVWYNEATGTVQFNGSVNSKLFKNEPYSEAPKRLKKRTKISFNTFFNNSQIKNWLDENVMSWVYIFVDSSQEYGRQLNQDSAQPKDPVKFQETVVVPVSATSNTVKNTFSSQFTILCYPILKGNKSLFVKKSFTDVERLYQVNKNGLFFFQRNNNDASFIYDIQMSNIPPFANQISPGTSMNIVATFNENGDMILQNSSAPSSAIYNFDVEYFETNAPGEIAQALGVLSTIPTEVESEYLSISNDRPIRFNINDIANQEFSYLHNPKMASEKFFEIKLENEAGDGFSYDLQKLNETRFKIKLSSPLTPGFSKSYLRIESEGGIYIPDTSKNFTGAVIFDDLSITRVTSQYAQMLANNKNYFQQQNLQYGRNLAKSMIGGAVGGAVTGGPLGVLSGMFAGAVGSLTNTVQKMIDTEYTLDNMLSAPRNVQQAKGDVFLYLSVNEPGFYLSLYESLETDMKTASDYNYLYGYSVKEKGFIGDYDNIRSSFNYVSADVEAIKAPISNIEKQRLRNKLNSVRFWNNDNVTFKNNNFERSIG